MPPLALLAGSLAGDLPRGGSRPAAALAAAVPPTLLLAVIVTSIMVATRLGPVPVIPGPERPPAPATASGAAP